MMKMVGSAGTQREASSLAEKILDDFIEEVRLALSLKMYILGSPPVSAAIKYLW